MSSTRSTKQQQRRQTAAKRQDNPAPNSQSGRPQGAAVVIRPPPGDSDADTLFVPKQEKKHHVDFSKPNPEFVTIFVGQSDTKPFKIHLDAIIAYSPYFRTAFTNKDYNEAETKTMKLEDIDEKVFGIFNNWLYRPEYLRTNDATELGLLEVAKLWTAAGKWKIPSLQNQCMGLLARMTIKDSKPPTKTKDNILHQLLVHAYSAKEDTPLKKLAVQKMIRVLPFVISLKEWAAEFPNGLIVDLSEALMKHHQSLPSDLKNPFFRTADYMLPEEE